MVVCMKVLLIGGGAREHAIAMALKKNELVELYTLMKNKNPGIYALSEEVSFNSETDVPAIKEFAEKIKPEIAVIGPESPLGVGASDLLEEMGKKTSSAD